MKLVAMLLMLLFVVSCVTKKSATNELTDKVEEVKKEAEVDEYYELFIGKVRVDEGCGFYIEIIVEHEIVKLYPVNLSEDLKKKNLKIEFSYRESKAMTPQNCRVDRIVSIDHVKMITE